MLYYKNYWCDGVWRMAKSEITMLDALKFTRHDFLNELQIILMHIDLDNAAEAKEKILLVTDELKQYAQLGKMGSPALEKWLTTFEWSYPSFRQTLKCDLKSRIQFSQEYELITFLDNLFDEVTEVIQLVSEYDVHFKLTASNEEWSLQIILEGELPVREVLTEPIQTIFVEKTISHNLWTFTIRGQ